MNFKYPILHTQELTIREVKKSDAKELIKYMKKVTHETDNLTRSSDEISESVRETTSMINNAISSENSIFLVALIDKDIVGNIVVIQTSSSKKKEHIASLGVAVLKKYWGLKIGSKLIYHGLAFMKMTNKITRVGLDVRSDNSNAVKLYKKFGFEIEGTYKNGFLSNGIYHDLYFMSTLLDDFNNKINYPLLDNIQFDDRWLGDIRFAVRTVLVNDKGEMALFKVRNLDYYKLPGCEINITDHLLDALNTEYRTIFNNTIRPVFTIGKVTEHRSKHDTLITSYCLHARVSSNNTILPDYEKSQGLELVWYSPEKALSLIKSSLPTDYAGGFIIIRDAIFIEKYLNILKHKK